MKYRGLTWAQWQKLHDITFCMCLVYADQSPIAQACNNFALTHTTSTYWEVCNAIVNHNASAALFQN